jgi:DNA-binding NarL/FixJ family response regulator
MSAPLAVLVVDDQAPFRSAMKAVLRRTTEFELVGEAANGYEAIALAEELDPALVLMDINMPEMNGIEATRQLVAKHPDVVVILCSTYEAADLPPEVATSGARAYLNKEHLGADSLRRLWAERDDRRIHLGLRQAESGGGSTARSPLPAQEITLLVRAVRAGGDTRGGDARIRPRIRHCEGNASTRFDEGHRSTHLGSMPEL